MSLDRLQKDFRDYLLDRSDRIAAEVAGDMAVYHHAYRAQLLGTLRDTFEKSWSWMGDEAFDKAAYAHIEAHPPSSWTLTVYGAGFDRSLAELHPNDPEIAELAWLEWHLRRAFDGPDSDQVDPATFEAVRKNPRLFLVARGHEQDYERTVGHGRGYFIVEKQEST